MVRLGITATTAPLQAHRLLGDRMSHRIEYVDEEANRFVIRCDCCGAEHTELVPKGATDMDTHSAILSARMYWFFNWGQQRHTCTVCLGKKIARSI